MTDNNTSWGATLGAGLIGYFLGNGGLFGNGCNGKNNGCGCNENCTISAIEQKVNDISEGNATKAILDATIAGDTKIREDLAQINRDNYALNVQSIYNQQTVARGVDNQFCKTQEIVVADGQATRAAIGAFETRYLEDRIHDRDLTIMKLQNELVAAPLACGLAAVNSKLDSVIGCAGVRTCGNSCGCGTSCGFPNYAVPPVGTFNIQKSYNPNVPTATA